MSRGPWLREAEVDLILGMIADGMKTTDIVKATGFSLGTVSNIRQGRIAKLIRWRKERRAAAEAAP